MKVVYFYCVTNNNNFDKRRRYFVDLDFAVDYCNKLFKKGLWPQLSLIKLEVEK